MIYIFKSAFSSEMVQHLTLLHNAGKYIFQIQSSLTDLDKYLVTNGFTNKVLDANTISAWLKTRDVSMKTKIKNLSHVKGFVKYLASLKIEASCPELPKMQHECVPYVFSDAEINRIVSAADNFEARNSLTRSVLVFPVLLRILRLRTAFGRGTLIAMDRCRPRKQCSLIREAKNLKQRFVPMDDSD